MNAVLNAARDSLANLWPELNAFHFLRPLWLWLLLPAIALLLISAWRDDVRRRWRGRIAPHLLDALVIERRTRWSIKPLHLTVAALMLGAIALAGPSWQQERPPFLEDKAPLAVAIDLGRSMDAIDITPTRLARAKLKLKALLAQRQGARTALYAYAGSTHLVLPLTDDSALLQTFVDALETRIMPPGEKNTTLALQTLAADLAKEDAPGTMLFLTDGIEPAAFPAFKAQVDKGSALPLVLGIGTAQGGPIQADGQDFVQSSSGQRLFARLDLAGLERLHSEAGVAVATLTPDSDEDVRWVQRRVQAHLAQKQAETQARWKDEGWWLCLPITLMALLWFRKGWTVRWLASLVLLPALLLSLAAPPQLARAQAASSPASAPASASAPPAASTDTIRQKLIAAWWNLWLTHDQQGRRALEQGRPAEAAELFDDPMWRGVALVRAHRYAEAVQSFARVDSAESDYDQGNALALQGRYEAAVERYVQALQRRPGWPQASHNLTLVRSLIPPKKPDEQDEEQDEPLDPDAEIRFDKKDDKGKQQVMVASRQTAETWMRAIQTSPTELLARKFALQVQQQEQQRPARPRLQGKTP